MKKKRKYRAFSLTEVLLSVGTLGVGMLFIAGVFPVGIHFTTIATERTIAAVVADEAFAKIRLYGIDFDPSRWPANPTVDFNDVSLFPLNRTEFAYPSNPGIDISQKQYSWSALCRRVELNSPLVQVTVFVCRRTAAGFNLPRPVSVGVEWAGAVPPVHRLRIRPRLPDASGEKTLINDGSIIVDNYSGQIYRVLERDPAADDEIVLDRNWDLRTPPPDRVWVVPPPAIGGRYPCIAVYQKLIRF